MDVRIGIIRVEVKEVSSFELQCQAETKSDGTVTKTATINTETQNSCPNFLFHFKQVCTSAVFLFTVICPGLEDIESSTESLAEKPLIPYRGQCLFPFTFSIANSKQLQHIASEVSVRAKQVQVAYLTTGVSGSDIKKVVGTIWFKVVCPKPVPKSKSRVTWTDLLNVVIKQIRSSEQSLLPSLPELLDRENDLTSSDPFLNDSAKICVVFHSVNTHLKTPDLTPVAKIGSEVIRREKALFNDTDGGNNLYTHSILKPVNLAFEHNQGYIELYLTNSDLIIFSAAHPLQMLLPFKQYNWEYNWRWMAGTGGLSPLHRPSGMEEPTMTASVMLKPSASHYPKFEGLEFLVYGVEIDSSVKNEDVVLSVEFADMVSKSRSQTAVSTLNTKIAPFMSMKESKSDAIGSRASLFDECTYDTSITVIKYGNTKETSPAYFFYPLNPFFRSKGKGVSLTLRLYAPNGQHKRRMWWQASRVASAVIEIPSTMSSVLSSPENINGVYWELIDADIAQSAAESVAFKIYGVLRWKNMKMKFLTSDIATSIHSLPNFNNLVPVNGIQPGLLTSILSEQLRGELETESKPESISDYKAAVKKMGIDILHLREQNKVLRSDNKKLEEHLLQLERSVIMSSADQAALGVLTKADLIHKILEQSQKLSTEIAARHALQDKVKALQNNLIAKNEVQAKLMQVQEAHSSQQKLVRDLQLKYEKYRKCADICKQQEEVIVQLDSLLEQNAKNGKVKEAIAVLSKENARLRKTLFRNQELSSAPRPSHSQEAIVIALRADVSKLRAKCSDLESQLNDSRRQQNKGLHNQTRVFKANQKVKIASAREKTLVHELEKNAKAWAQEKAQYEVQLAEYRAKVSILEEELANSTSRAVIQKHQSQTLNSVATSTIRSPNTHSRLQTRASEHSRNPWQSKSRADEVRRHPLTSVSQQLHPHSQNSITRSPHPSVYDDNSLETRLSF